MVKKERKTSEESLLQKTKACFFCGSTRRDLHRHHVFYGTANRRKSEEDLMWVYLCPEEHNTSSIGVHFNKELDLKLKKIAEKVWIANYTSKDENIEDRIDKFIKRYGKNYLDDEDLKNFSM